MRVWELSLFLSRSVDSIGPTSESLQAVEGMIPSHTPLQGGIALRILPLGASITVGLDSTGLNGYREPLRQLLEGSGNNVTYVGTRHVGTMRNNAVQAIPGQIIQQIDSTALSSNAYNFEPNVVLINAGTNNCARPNVDIMDTASAYAQLLRHIYERVPNALTVVSSLVPNLKPKVNACVEQLNPELRRVAMAARTTGQKIAYVDMYGAVPRSAINTTDSTHPNDAGYAIMARVWYEGLRRASVNISTVTAPQGPQPTNSADDDDTASSSTTGDPYATASDGTNASTSPVKTSRAFRNSQTPPSLIATGLTIISFCICVSAFT